MADGLDFTNELEADTWIGGNFNTYEFLVVDATNPTEPVDLTIFTEIRWCLFRYGDFEHPILNLLGIIQSTNHAMFLVSIDSKYTEDLSGLFIHQPILVDGAGRQFIPAQGLINIIPRASYEDSLVIEQKLTPNNKPLYM